MYSYSSVLLDEDSSDSLNCPKKLHSSSSLQEKSFDSGYFEFSPDQSHTMSSRQSALLSDAHVVSPMKGLTVLPQGGSGTVMEEMSHKPGLYEDVSLSSEWENDFFANFEENLFTLDLDDQTLDDILKSPKGKVALSEMINSPKGKSIMNSPKGKKIKDRMKLFDTPESSPGQRILGYSDPNKLGRTPMKPDAQHALKMSKRKLSLITPNTNNPGMSPTYVNETQKLRKIQPNVSKENEAPVVWPSQERLKFARNHFKITLEKAVQNVNEQVAQLRKSKSDQYPQLSKALSKPAANKRQKLEVVGGNTERRISNRQPKPTTAGMLLSNCRLEDIWDEANEDEDDVWMGDLPFTGLKQATKKRKGKDVGGQGKRRKVSQKYRK